MRWYALLIGYGFPVLVGVLLMKNVVERLWECLTPEGARSTTIRPEAWQPLVLALLETVLYIAFLQMGQAWFIGAWMAFKIAGQWKRWGESADEKTFKPAGHVVFNVFLIGNGFLILYAFVGYKLIGWINREQWLRAFWAPALIVCLNIVFYFWLARFRKCRPLAESAKKD
jgi:hypothetical protein